MPQIDVSTAGKQLAKLIESGEEIELTRYGRIVAVLIPADSDRLLIGMGTSRDVTTRHESAPTDRKKWVDPEAKEEEDEELRKKQHLEEVRRRKKEAWGR